MLMQIRSQGIQPVCENLAPEPVTFPPRNLSLDFLTQLDAFYRDALARPIAWSRVDQEGKAVWLQEYLRYRIDGQSAPRPRTRSLLRLTTPRVRRSLRAAESSLTSSRHVA